MHGIKLYILQSKLMFCLPLLDCNQEIQHELTSGTNKTSALDIKVHSVARKLNIQSTSPCRAGLSLSNLKACRHIEIKLKLNVEL